MPDENINATPADTSFTPASSQAAQPAATQPQPSAQGAGGAASLPFGLAPSGMSQTPTTPMIEPNTGPGYGLGNPQPANTAQANAGQPAAPQQAATQQPAAQQQPAQATGEAQGQAPQPPLDSERQPITDFSKIDLGLGDAPVNPKILAGFEKVSIEQQLTEAQVKALAQWQAQTEKELRDAHFAEQSQKLKQFWGKDFDRNAEKVNSLCARISREPGLEAFQDELVASGAGNSAVVYHGLLCLANLLAEDSLGRISGAGAAPETALDGLRDVWERARGDAVKAVVSL